MGLPPELFGGEGYPPEGLGVVAIIIFFFPITSMQHWSNLAWQHGLLEGHRPRCEVQEKKSHEQSAENKSLSLFIRKIIFRIYFLPMLLAGFPLNDLNPFGGLNDLHSSNSLAKKI